MASFMHNVELFENEFFGVPSSRASQLDTSECVLAQVLVEAIIDAGYTHRDPRLLDAALVTSVTSTDYEQHGSWECMAPRSIANLCGVHGHVENVNTICSR